MRYNESISKVLTTPAEWQEWLETIIKKRREWLQAQNCGGCFGSSDKEQPPDKYPVLAMMDATAHGFSLAYIYRDQIMELLFGAPTKKEIVYKNDPIELLEDRFV